MFISWSWAKRNKNRGVCRKPTECIQTVSIYTYFLNKNKLERIAKFYLSLVNVPRAFKNARIHLTSYRIANFSSRRFLGRTLSVHQTPLFEENWILSWLKMFPRSVNNNSNLTTFWLDILWYYAHGQRTTSRLILGEN